jgi:hypothetical protein
MKNRRKQSAISRPDRFILPCIFIILLMLFAGTLSVYGDASQPDLPPTGEDQPAIPSKTVLLTAPELIRVGDTVELTFSCNAKEIRAVQGSLIYNPAVLTYVSSETVPDDWSFTFLEEEGKLKYLGLSTENRGVTGKTALFTATFRIHEDVSTESDLLFTASDATAYDGHSEITLEGGDFTFPVIRALSDECTLTELSIAGGNLSPAFSPEIKEYSVTLPYTAHRADISATACQYGKLKYSSRDLSIGENVITVTVISETGLQQVYTIHVTRAADPNYVPSTDNRVLKLNLSDAMLFPAFSPEITEYTVYLVQGYDVFLTPTAAPNAVADGLFIRAVPAPDSDADAPTAGTYTIICYAEDGTPRTYTFHTILVSSPEQLEEVRKQNEEPSYVVLMVICIIVFVMVCLALIAYVIGRAHPSGRKPLSKQTTPDVGVVAEPSAEPADPEPIKAPITQVSVVEPAPASVPVEEPTTSPTDDAANNAAEIEKPQPSPSEKGKHKKKKKKH